MFIISLLTFLYGLVAMFTIFLVLLQRGKGNMGLGNMGGSNQAIFGSSGGQDLFQKITWICLILILGGSLLLATIRGKQNITSRRYQTQRSMPQNDYESVDF